MAIAAGHTKAAPVGAVWFAMTVVVLALGVVEWAPAVGGQLAFTPGWDFGLYRDQAAQWLAGGAFYPSHELAGAFTIIDGDLLYPPTILALTVPFTVLPAVLWWAIPLGIVAWVVRHHRPRPEVWPFLALCLVFPTTGIKIATGNPVMWVWAAVALGTVYGWPAVAVLLKPTLAPFALVGINRRSWWVALLVGAVASLVFLPLWLDYATVLHNAHDPRGPFYSAQEAVLLMLPILAWAGRRQDTSRVSRSRTPAS